MLRWPQDSSRSPATGPLLLLRDRVQHVLAHERAERLGYHDGAVLLLVVLQDRDDPPRGGQRAVERRDEPRLPTLAAWRMLSRRAWNVGAVRRGGQLPLAALRRQPRLAVVLARRARPQVPGGDVDHPVAQLDPARNSSPRPAAAGAASASSGVA